MVEFITKANWVFLLISVIVGIVFLPGDFARGILFGGCIVTVNFHLLSRTLRNSLRPENPASPNSILAKYYLRFLASGIIIFILIWKHMVHPIGLFIGLSVVVASIFMATMIEIKNLFMKEAI